MRVVFRFLSWRCLCAALWLLLLAGCQHQAMLPVPAMASSPADPRHLEKSQLSIAPRALDLPLLVKPKAVTVPAPLLEKYTVTVRDVPITDLLNAIAQDTKMNIDIHPNLTGRVSLQAYQQPLNDILARLAAQVDMRYEYRRGALLVQADAPYLKTYAIDYLNLQRSSTASIATQLGAKNNSTATTASALENNSATSVASQTSNDFWRNLAANLQSLLDLDLSEQERQRRLTADRDFQVRLAGAGNDRQWSSTPSGSSAVTYQSNSAEVLREALQSIAATNSLRNVVTNPEAGTISVFASDKQHQGVQKFLDSILAASRRQVLIEATIAEVHLNDRYQAGIDWSVMGKSLGGVAQWSQTTSTQAGVTQAGALPALLFQWANPDSVLGSLNVAVSLLNQFGTAKVLSSPKIMALNNQPAMLKVTEDVNYFEQDGTQVRLRSLPVGITLTVMPMVSSTNQVSLVVRPTISRLKGYITHPTIANNRIPELYSRELETVLSLGNGQMVMLGGLMEDETTRDTAGVPWLARLPVIGDAFAKKQNQLGKSELVILLRPMVLGTAEAEQRLTELQTLPVPDLPPNAALPSGDDDANHAPLVAPVSVDSQAL